MSGTYDPTQALEVIRAVSGASALPRSTPSTVRSALEEFATLDEWMRDGGRPPAQWRARRRGRPPLTEDGPINETLKQGQHGTRYGYNHACHCTPCRAANRGEDPAVIHEMLVERGWA